VLVSLPALLPLSAQVWSQGHIGGGVPGADARGGKVVGAGAGPRFNGVPGAGPGACNTADSVTRRKSKDMLTEIHHCLHIVAILAGKIVIERASAMLGPQGHTDHPSATIQEQAQERISPLGLWAGLAGAGATA